MTKARDKIQKLFAVEHQNRPNSCIGVVQQVFPSEYLCNVMIVDNDSTRRAAPIMNVPLPMIGGMTYAMPHVGDKVLVEFLSGDRAAPYVVAIYPASTLQLSSLGIVTSSTLGHFSNLE